MPFPNDWNRRVPLSIDNTLCGSEDSSDFTVLITRNCFLDDEICSPTDPNRAQSDGGDLRFSSDAAGTNRIPVNVINWEYDSSDGAGDADIVLEVKSTINGTTTGTDAVIYCWYNTSSTETQPLESDTYGASNAYDGNHMHVYSLKESVSDPEFKDIVGNRHLTKTSASLTNSSGQHGGTSVNTDPGMINSDFSGIVPPNSSTGNPLTNTGLCYISGEDIVATINFDDNEVVEVNKNTGVEVTRFAVTEGETQLKGLAHDPVADEYWIAEFSGSATKHVYERDGTFSRTVILTSTNPTIAYDFTDDAMWSSTGSGNVTQYNKSTGVLISSVTVTGAAAGIVIEGIAHNSTDNTLYLTTNTGNMVYEINKSTGATIQSFRGPFDIEHPAYDHDDDILWVNGDSRWTLTGENVIYKLNPDGGAFGNRALTDQYTVEYWLYPNAFTSTDIVSAFWTGVRPDAFYCEVQSRSGAIRVYDPDVGQTQAGSFTLNTWQHIWIEYNETASQLSVFKDNTQVINDTSASGSLGPCGRISFGGRPDVTLLFNGRFEFARLHNVVRSASWRTARHNNSSSPSTFITGGTPTSPESGTPSGSGSVSGTGELVAVGAVTHAGSGSVVGTGELVGFGLVTHIGSGSVAAAGDLIGTGSSTHSGLGSVLGTGELSGAGSAPSVVSSGSGSVVATGVLSGVGFVQTTGVGSIVGVGDLAGAGSAQHTGSGSVVATGELAGAGSSPSLISSGAGAVEATASLDGLGFASFSGIGSIEGTASLDGVGLVQMSGVGAVAGVGLLDGVGSNGTAGSQAYLWYYRLMV